MRGYTHDSIGIVGALPREVIKAGAVISGYASRLLGSQEICARE